MRRGNQRNRPRLVGSGSEMISLTVNGKPRDVDGELDLISFLLSYDVNLEHVAVGYNGEVLEKDDYSQVFLKAGDVPEIVRPVGGGQL